MTKHRKVVVPISRKLMAKVVVAAARLGISPDELGNRAVAAKLGIRWPPRVA